MTALDTDIHAEKETDNADLAEEAAECCCKCFCSYWSAWMAARLKSLLQVERWSVGRLESFLEYRDTASSTRVALVILLNHLPTCSVMVLLNLVPLASPRQGLAANYVFFLRMYLCVLVLMIGIKWQRQSLLQYQPSWKTTLFLNNFAAVLNTFTTWLLPTVIGVFPVPFAPLLGLACGVSISFVVFRVILSRLRGHRVARVQPRESAASAAIPSDSNGRDTLTKYLHLMLFQYSLPFVYSAVTVGFRRVDGIYQMLFTLVLPLVRIILTVIGIRLVSHIEDFSTETLVFIVEFFNTMYVSICMGGAKSVWSSLALIAFDFLHMAFTMYEVNLHSHHVAQVHLKAFGPGVSGSHQSKDEDRYVDVIESCVHIAHIHRRNLGSVKIGGSYGVKLKKNSVLTSMMQKVGRMVSTVQNLQVVGLQQQSAPSKTMVRVVQPAPIVLNENDDTMQFVRQMLIFMHLIEHSVLIEYIEAFVPFFYAAYMNVTFYSCNHDFFYGIRELNEHQMRAAARNMLWYGLLECFSLIVLFCLVKRRFGVNVFTLLAFVLETHFFNIQGKMLLSMMLILNFNLVHYGMDFDFKFEFRTSV